MEPAFISALSALGGSVIGGLASGVTTWMSQRAQIKAGERARDGSRREDLYKDFIVAASKVYADALTHNEPKIEEVVTLYALTSRMRVLSSQRIVACAEKITHNITDVYFEPNKTVRELHELARDNALDPLREFSGLARDELLQFRTAIEEAER